MRRIRPNTPTRPTTPAPAGERDRHAVPSRFTPCLFFLGFALLAALVHFGGIGGPDGLPPDVNPVSASAESPRYVTKEIREIRIFDWVLARNPELTEADRAEFPEIEPDRWRLVKLQMPKQDGSRLDISLARPIEWLAANGVGPGKTIDLDLPEMGAEGPADVISISACPTPDAKPAPRCRLITGTFRHTTADILDISVAGQSKPIGTTPAHPFWSEDRHAFVPAGQLRQGERLRTAHGEINQVAKISERPTGEAVYNLEVDVEHVYYVTTDAVLVHNEYRERWGRPHRKPNVRHNNAIEDELDWAHDSLDASSLRKDRVQRDVNGNRVYTRDGSYVRPDASYVADGTRYNTNYVSNIDDLDREMEAFEKMCEADPEAVNTLIVVY